MDDGEERSSYDLLEEFRYAVTSSKIELENSPKPVKRGRALAGESCDHAGTRWD
jgi:hypothetical protein